MATSPQVRKEIKETIKSLAKTQGFYSRLHEACEYNGWLRFEDICDEHDFIDVVDFIMWLEG